MRTVHKYPVHLLEGGRHTIYLLPVGAQVIRFADQRGGLFMWVDLNTGAGTEQRAFQVLGTGHELPGGATHRGSCEQGSFVWHLYEVAP